MEHKEIKKGIKQVELDRGVYNISIFFAIVFGLIGGTIAGCIMKSGWAGALVGLVIVFTIGIPAANRYYEIDNEK